MKIVIAGASGFVGSALSRTLLDAGHAVTGLGTSTAHPLESMARFKWHAADTTRAGDWQSVVGDADAVVNLAGRTIFKRWSKAYKAQLIDSRILTTRNLVSALTGENNILISTSAVGYYGSRGDQMLTEDSPPGTDFLARLSVDWENAALDAEKKAIRVAIMRFGVVLGAGGGALAQMLPAFRMFAGGPLGRGRQWFSWIHMADLLSAVQFLLDHEHARGPYNFCAPGAVRQKEPPSLALRLMMGEMAGVLLASHFRPCPGIGAGPAGTRPRALPCPPDRCAPGQMRPDRLMADGFGFRFADVDSALADLVGQS
jgi:uncharacterized protein (TIGR01777 family)